MTENNHPEARWGGEEPGVKDEISQRVLILWYWNSSIKKRSPQSFPRKTEITSVGSRFGTVLKLKIFRIIYKICNKIIKTTLKILIFSMD